MNLFKMFRNLISILLLIIECPIELISQSQIDSLKNLVNKTEASTKVKLYTDIADGYFYEGNNDSAITYYLKSADYSLEISDTAYADALNGYINAAYCYIEISNFKEAIKYNKLGLKYSLLANDQPNISTSYSSLGVCYTRVGQYSLAAIHFEKSLDIDKKIGNTEYLSYNYNSLGKLYQLWGKNELALEYYRMALGYDTKFNNEDKMAIRLNSIGMTFRNLKQYDSAEIYLKKALFLDQKSGNKNKVAIRKSNLGSVYTAMGKYSSAEENYLSSINVFKETQNLYSLCLTYSNYADLLLLKKQLDQSKLYSNKSLELAKKIRSPIRLKDNYKRLSAIYDLEKNYKLAFENYKAFKAINDTLFNEESLKTINNLEVKYETEKLESENLQLKTKAELNELVIQRRNIVIFSVITLALMILTISIILYRQNRQKAINNKVLKEKNAQLSVLNATKDKFFRIISHDLKNPLSAFRNITSALSNSVDEINKEEIKYFTNELNNSSTKLYELLVNLLKWAQTQTGMECKFNKVNLNKEVEGIIKLYDLNIKEKKQNIVVDIKHNTEVLADDKFVKTVIRNLLSNAIKFTPENGSILIYTENKNDKTHTHIKDSGIGMSLEDQKKLFKIDKNVKSIGNSKEKGTGLGLIICQEMLKKCNGSISVKSELGKGSTFTFILKTAN